MYTRQPFSLSKTRDSCESRMKDTMINLRDSKLGKTRHRGRTQRLGAAAVEFAIVAPLFFMLVFGCIEFGRALMVQQILTNASRVGARDTPMGGPHRPPAGLAPAQ